MSRKSKISYIATEELEPRFLAKIFLKNNSIAKIMDKISADKFSTKHNSNIYHAIFSLFKDDKYIDDMTVVNRMQELGYTVSNDLLEYVKKISNGYGHETSALGVETYAEEIDKRFKTRKAREKINELYTNQEELVEKGTIINELMNAGVYIADIVHTNSLIERVSVDKENYLSEIDQRMVDIEFKLDGLPYFWDESTLGFSKTDIALNGATEGQII